MLSIADTCVSYTSGKLTYADVTSVLGSADFSGVAELCEAALCGDAGRAFERAETFLAAGKGVGTLVKDVMNFLNACAIAKMCRDGKNILALPDGSYAEVEKIARKADGHRLLRATEIFAEAEQNLKYSTSPRILFETAVMKASMPQTDYDIEALIARIAALEERLEKGDFAPKTGDTYKANEKSATVLAPVKQAETRVEKQAAVEEEFAPPEMEAPPDEAETGGNVYFDEGFLPSVKKAPAPTPKPAVAPTPAPVKEVPAAATPAFKPAVKGDAKTTFGTFLRALRKTGRNGVLFTICMDLDSVYEGDTFALYTGSETIYRSLTKPEHYALIKDAFAAIGIEESGFALQLRGKKTDGFEQGVEKIKQTFGGVKVEVK